MWLEWQAFSVPLKSTIGICRSLQVFVSENSVLRGLGNLPRDERVRSCQGRGKVTGTQGGGAQLLSVCSVSPG